MSFKKYDGSTWQSINPKQLKGIPYTGTLPAVLAGTKAGYLHKYKVYGNLEQTGTPTPENPIYPSECGERTENLFDADTIYSAYKQTDGTYQGTVNNFYTSHPTPFTASDIGKTFTFSIKVNATTSGNVRASANVGGTDINGNNLSEPGITKVTFTVSSTNDYLHLGYDSGGGNQITISDIMLVEGSTTLPYEPYGYKLPLLSGSTPVDIYLGESQTTRRIRKLVLTGTEDIGYDSAYTRFSLKLPDCLLINVRRTPAFCTHYEVIDDGRTISNVPDNSMYSHNTESRWYIKTTDYSSANALKAFLAQQYANGTPVTVWYVLATPTTGTLNEPLRKIGDYADTIDSTQTTAQIPTTANSTTISWAGQGLAPSQFDSIQEWVDIPTYKRVNGEWVADN